ncbi:hypothetical protein [Kineosporia mesophila]|uniref:hypothetical protein n=1 Tax=Kineosporia mesophila TaxID=566012 RepID=UPI001E51AB7D|nr:hypothetical protein [Kineosporia mesophila]MCD5353234.1 hypothetical protein [Kineosporia mesophila]
MAMLAASRSTPFARGQQKFYGVPTTPLPNETSLQDKTSRCDQPRDGDGKPESDGNAYGDHDRRVVVEAKPDADEDRREDHRLVAALEKLMKHLGPKGARVPVQNVAKVVPLVGILIGDGMNFTALGNVAADAQRYCQTRWLCEKHSLPLPATLAPYQEDTEPPQISPSQDPTQ